MAKVKLLVSRAGADGSQNVGDEVEVSVAEAERMVAAGQAELVRRAARETATAKPKRKTEKAAR